MGFNIAIDGPAGAGKSTIAKRLAADLNFIYVDTGAMYRAIGLYMIKNGIDGQDEKKVSEACQDVKVELAYVEGAQKVILNGDDVSGDIRKEEVGQMASTTSRYPAVRAKLLDLQRNIAAENDVIMDGRDIGTCILPNAELKVYLTASVETRAKRRFDELVEKGEQCDINEIAKGIAERDHQDMNREIAPLKAADDAITVDSSFMTIEEVVNCITDLAVQKGLK